MKVAWFFLEISPPPGEIFDQLLTPFRFGGHEKKCRKKVAEKKTSILFLRQTKTFLWYFAPTRVFTLLSHSQSHTQKTPLLTLFHSFCLPYSPSHTYFSYLTGSHSPPRPLSHIPISDFYAIDRPVDRKNINCLTLIWSFKKPHTRISHKKWERQIKFINGLKKSIFCHSPFLTSYIF